VPGSLVGKRRTVPDHRQAAVHTAEIVLGLLVLATAVATFAERLRVPAPSLLVLAGLAVGLLPGVPDVNVSPDVVGVVVLPPLLYAAAVDVVLSDLTAVLRPVALLAIVLVVVSALTVAVVVHLMVPGVSVSNGLVLGAALAATDPVAVSALARRLRLPPRLLALVQGESLLNDATSLLLFRIAVAGVVAGHLAGPVGLPLRFLELGLGGAAVGLACAVVIDQLGRRTVDPVVATVIALITPYAIFVAAENAHTSGVTAVVFGGLYLGRRRALSARGPARLQISYLYGVLVFVLEGVVFAIIGLELPTLVRALPSSEDNFVLIALAITATLLTVRVLWVTVATFLPGLMDRTDERDIAARRGPVVAVVAWAGTRGVVPLAAALSIPLTVKGGAPFPNRDLLLVLVTTCTAITLVVQGLSLGPLVRRAGLSQDPRARATEEALARHAAIAAAMARLEELEDADAAPTTAVSWLRREFADRLERATSVLEAEQRADIPGALVREDLQALRRELIGVQSGRLHELVQQGRISEATRRRVQRRLDLEEARAADD
jgi:Na+/H+ antiporter